MNDSIFYTITSSEFAKRLEVTKYRLLPAFVIIILFLAIYAYYDSGISVTISVLIIGLIFVTAGVIKIRFQKPTTSRIDVEINSDGITITKDKATHYEWNKFRKVMTSTEYADSYSPSLFYDFGFKQLYYKSAQISEETHGRVFFLIYKKTSPFFGNKYLILYAEPNNFQEVERLLHQYLPHPSEITQNNKLKNIVIGLAIMIVAVGLAILLFSII